MTSGPLTADIGPLDFDHLERITLGEKALEREVLEMFLAQSARLLEMLASFPLETTALAHTLKGSARAVGAFKLADRAAALEAVGQEHDRAGALAALRQTVAEARFAIEARLGRS